MTFPRESGFLNRNGYVVYVPRDYDPARSWPVILFLHGAGERGIDPVRATQIGVGAAIRHEPSRVPAIVVFPIAPQETRWLDVQADDAMRALDEAIDEFHGDRDRVYLTGLSMGGYGVWHLALAHPGRFAALVVVCGGLLPHATTTSVQQSPFTKRGDDPYAFTARSLHEVPIWMFHGTVDDTIPVEESRKMDEALRAAAARDEHYTEVPAMGHNVWDKAYSDDAMWKWLFAQRLRL